MSGDSEDPGSTRPISVAELLARNGTIGAPPSGGRRRRRRGRDGTVTVAELTGEIPVIRDADPPPTAVEEPPVEQTGGEPVEEPAAEDVAQDAGDIEDVAQDAGDIEDVAEDTGEDAEDTGEDAEDAEDVAEDAGEDAEGVAEGVAEDAGEDAEGVAEDAGEDVAEQSEDVAATESSEAEPDAPAEVEQTGEIEPVEGAPDAPPLAGAPLPTRPDGPVLGHDPRPVRRASGAEQMAPDPVDVPVDLAGLVGASPGRTGAQPSYLRSSGGTLFGGQTVADDMARRGMDPDAQADAEAEATPPGRAVKADRPAKSTPRPADRAALLRESAGAALQSVVAVIFGAGLFIGFDQLWRWNTIVALVLSVLVILGLVIAVRVVRRTEDIASTLIAVAVGALVTLGPLALLQSYG